MAEKADSRETETRETRTRETGTRETETRATGTEETMTEDPRLAEALKTLRRYLLNLAREAGESEGYGEELWQEILSSQGLLQELAYYHDYGEFLCRYSVAGYTLPDVLVWQVDHFKLYMDRPEDMNRYRSNKLLLEAFHTLAQMEKEPDSFAEKMQEETGQDIPF